MSAFVELVRVPDPSSHEVYSVRVHVALAGASDLLGLGDRCPGDSGRAHGELVRADFPGLGGRCSAEPGRWTA